MNYFNFFENGGKEKKALNLPFLSVMLFLAAALVLGGIYLTERTKLSTAESRLSYLDSVKNDPLFQAQCAEEKALADSLGQAEQDYVFLRTAEYLTEEGSTVDDELVRTVMSYFTAGTKIIKMTVSKNEVTVDGVADKLQTMINVEKKLNAGNDFGYVFVTSAKQDGHPEENGANAVSFNCKLTLAEKGSGK